MPFAVEMAALRAVLNGLQFRLATGVSGGELLLIDFWDRKCFGEFVDHEFTVEEWEDFVDHCSHETIPWVEWFGEWKDQRGQPED